MKTENNIKVSNETAELINALYVDTANYYNSISAVINKQRGEYSMALDKFTEIYTEIHNFLSTLIYESINEHASNNGKNIEI